MEKKIALDVINSHAAGIDVGSRSHHVAVGQDLIRDVKEFGVYAASHEQMIAWLRERKVKTIAMESTGSYWQTLFASLQCAGFEVILVNGNQIKNVKGKTDVKDCRWIQKLHTLDLLRGSFLPAEHTAQMRTYYHHRQSMIEESSKMINKMQKAMRLMNVRLDIAVSDIKGKSGIAIIEAILRGERDGEKLAALADWRVKKSRQEISQALQGNWRKELLYELKDCYELYQIFQVKMEKCDKEIEQLLKGITTKMNPAAKTSLSKVTQKRQAKNQVNFNLPKLSYVYTGVDLFAIEGVSYNTIMSFIAEVGDGIKKFATAKQFDSWLRLAPNNKISGNKRISSRTPQGKHRFAQSLLQAANTVGQMKKGVLPSFFKRIAFKKGRQAAIVATARKTAVIIWNMITHQIPYKPLEERQYSTKVKNAILRNIKNKLERLDLTINDLALLSKSS
jgi:transposase